MHDQLANAARGGSSKTAHYPERKRISRSARNDKESECRPTEDGSRPNGISIKDTNLAR
jgi:hypothetical protein